MGQSLGVRPGSARSYHNSISTPPSRLGVDRGTNRINQRKSVPWQTRYATNQHITPEPDEADDLALPLRAQSLSMPLERGLHFICNLHVLVPEVVSAMEKVLEIVARDVLRKKIVVCPNRRLEFRII